MKRKKILFNMLVIALFVTPSFLFSQSLQNKIIKVSTDIVGNFKIWTTGGDPKSRNDNNKDLLNNKKFASSFVLVYVDGKVGRYGSSAGRNLQFSKLDGNKIVSKWQFQDIVFTQEISLYKGVYSGYRNLARIQVWVKNVSPKAKSVGIKVVLDSSLGDSDENGFYVPGKGLVSKGLLIEKEQDIPTIIYSCGNPIGGQANFELNLYGKDLVRPDSIYFTREEYLSPDTGFFVDKKQNSFFDNFAGNSSVGLLWNPRLFQPKEDNGIAFAVGASIGRSQPGQPVDIYGTVPMRVRKEDFWIGAVIRNSDKFWDMKQVTVQVEFDSDYLKIVSKNETFSIDRLERTKKIFSYWKFKPLKYGESNITVIIKGFYRSRPITAYIKEHVLYKRE